MSVPTRWRAAGLVATVLLAISAYLAGALPRGDPAPALRVSGTAPASFWLGLACWLIGSVLLAVAWWRGRSLTARQVIITGSLWAVPLLLAPPLASRDLYAYACQGATVSAGADPYAVGAAEAGCPWLAAVPEIWQHSTAPYGPLGMALSAGVVRIADPHLWVAVLGLRVVALAGLALIGWFGVRLARATGMAPQVALWAGLATPLVLIHAVSGAHNDALVAGLLVAALALAAEHRTGLPATGSADLGPAPAGGHPALGWRVAGAVAVAGACLAGAVAVKVTAIVALPFVLILAGRRWWIALAGAAGTFAALNGVTGLGFGWVGALTDTQQLTQWTSVPTGVGMAVGYLLRAAGHPESAATSISAARLVGVLILGLIGLVALRRAWRAETRTVVAACGWFLAAVALLGPVFYPWYALTPLAVLACVPTVLPRVRAAVTIALIFLVLPHGLGLAALTKGPGAVAVLIGVVWLAVTAGRARFLAVRARSRARA